MKEEKENASTAVLVLIRIELKSHTVRCVICINNASVD